MPYSLLVPVKAAIGEWLTNGFHAQVFPDTPALVEWSQRLPAKACMWAESRMVDSVEDLLSSVRNNATNDPRVGTATLLPMLTAAIATEWQEPDAGQLPRMVHEAVHVRLPNDPHRRVFRLKTMAVDLRCQIAVIAADPGTVMSLIGQLSGWAAARQRIRASFPFEHLPGVATLWPVTIVPGDRMSIGTPVGEQLKVMTLDLTVRAVLPMIFAPRPGDAVDDNSPPGLMTTAAVASKHAPLMGPPTGVGPAEWGAYLTDMDRVSVYLMGVKQ